MREQGSLTFVINTVQVFNKTITAKSISNFTPLPTINHRSERWDTAIKAPAQPLMSLFLSAGETQMQREARAGEGRSL